GTRIPHRDAHLFLGALSADPQVTLCEAAHRLNGVDDQIEHHLLKLDPVSPNARQAIRQTRLHPDSVLLYLAANHGHDFQDCIINIDRIPPWGSFFHQTMDPVYHSAGSVDVLDD